jgi:hypothetical protein
MKLHILERKLLSYYQSWKAAQWSRSNRLALHT